MTFKALLATKTGKAILTGAANVTEHDLMPGDVTIAADYSAAPWTPSFTP